MHYMYSSIPIGSHSCCGLSKPSRAWPSKPASPVARLPAMPDSTGQSRFHAPNTAGAQDQPGQTWFPLEILALLGDNCDNSQDVDQ